MPSTDPHSAPRKSWSALTAQARRATPPVGIDVRFAVRAAIEAEAANQSRRYTAARRTLMDDIVSLSQSLIGRFALGGCAALATVSLWKGLGAAAGLSAAIDFQGLFMAF